MHVLDDADHDARDELERRPRPRHMLGVDALADRRLAWPDRARERVIDDDDRPRLAAVLRSEESTLAQPNSHRLEITGGDRTVVDRETEATVVSRPKVAIP